MFAGKPGFDIEGGWVGARQSIHLKRINTKGNGYVSWAEHESHQGKTICIDIQTKVVGKISNQDFWFREILILYRITDLIIVLFAKSDEQPEYNWNKKKKTEKKYLFPECYFFGFSKTGKFIQKACFQYNNLFRKSKKKSSKNYDILWTLIRDE